MGSLSAKRILLGVTGGIAAYKSADLVRRLREQGAEVQVVMTRNACEFITPLTMQALSGRPVYVEILDADQEAAMGHITLARWSDAVLVAPASANFLAKLAHGQADDLLSTLCLATDAALLVAPAMNEKMWVNRATGDNMELLRRRGIGVLGPGIGSQACGESGAGRMLEPLELVAAIESVFSGELLAGLNVLVTAGPTHEAIDPVRFISNRSSGRMGYAVARAAAEAGAAVTLVSGPVSLTAPERVRCVRVTSAMQMYDEVLGNAAAVDIFISAAAVADYRCAAIADHKIKKTADQVTLTLAKNPDILAAVAALEAGPFTVGFAAETRQLRQHATAKLKCKGVDMIAANQVGEGMGIDTADNALNVFWAGGERQLHLAPKEQLARALVALIAERFHARQAQPVG